MKKIQAAVIGCGGWGPNLLNVFFSNIETKLKWMCDLEREKGWSFSNRPFMMCSPQRTIRIS